MANILIPASIFPSKFNCFILNMFSNLKHEVVEDSGNEFKALSALIPSWCEANLNTVCYDIP